MDNEDTSEVGGRPSFIDKKEIGEENTPKKPEKTPSQPTERAAFPYGGVRFAKGNVNKRTVMELRKASTYKVAAWVNNERMLAILRSLYEIATDPKNRQCVAAANTLLDRVCGPVSQQLSIEVSDAGQSVEEKRRALLVRFSEIVAASTPPALPAPAPSPSPGDLPPG